MRPTHPSIHEKYYPILKRRIWYSKMGFYETFDIIYANPLLDNKDL